VEEDDENILGYSIVGSSYIKPSITSVKKKLINKSNNLITF
jgi:hypothetical protein